MTAALNASCGTGASPVLSFSPRSLTLPHVGMINGYDIAYGVGLAVSAPLWLIKPSWRSKVLGALRGRMGQVATRDLLTPAVMIHAVSVGELNATPGLVKRLRELLPALHLIISTTSNTGFARAQELYGKDSGATVIRYPLDFTSAVSRVLDQLRPSLVVLMELELWPNFLKQCSRRKIPVVLANGRITPSSYRHYKLIRPVIATMLRRLSAVCAQDQTFADRFKSLGAPVSAVHVTGTMKFDTAAVGETVDGADLLRAEIAIKASEKLWVCGSTGPGEEETVLHHYKLLLTAYPNLRLAIIPRHPERFDRVAEMIRQAGLEALRLTQIRAGAQPKGALPVILGDTMGELRKFYVLADVVFVGRTLVDLGPRQHGSDMIEPAGLGKPVVVGPYTANFAAAMSYFREARALTEVSSGKELGEAIGRLLSDPGQAMQMGQRARDAVVRGRGATERHVEVILRYLNR